MTAREQFGIRIAPGTRETLAEVMPARVGQGYILEAWPTLAKRTLADLRGKFTTGELCVLIEAVNGLYLTPGLAGQHIGLSVADAMRLDGVADKWGVDEAILNAKLEALTILESVVIELWAARYWDDPTQAVHSYAESLYVKKVENK